MSIVFAGHNVGIPFTLFGDLKDGDSRHGLNDGSWGLNAAIREICDQTGPKVQLTIGVWTASTGELRALRRLLDEHYFASVRFMIDRSMPARDKQATRTLRELFGVGAIRVWSSHAKFVTFSHGRVPVLLLTSANLARNRNIENWSVFVDEWMVEDYLVLATRLWERQSGQVGFDEPARARRDTAAVQGAPTGLINTAFVEDDDGENVPDDQGRTSIYR